jgi:tetratricopeptide (TPR) repeat protein
VTLIFLCLTLGLIAAASRAAWGTAPEEETATRPRRATIHAPLAAPASSSGIQAPRWYAFALAAIGIAAVIGVALPVNVRMYRAQILKRQAQQAGAAGRVHEATAPLREACHLVPFERTYHVDLANCLAGEASLDDGQAAMVEAFRAAERELRAAVALDPGDIRTYWPLGLLYRLWGSLDPSKFAAAEEVYQRAAAMSPRRQRTYWAWGDLMLAQGKREEALAKYRHALEIDPSVAASQRALARLHVQLGEPEHAEPLYQRAWQTPGVLIPANERAAEQEALGLAFLSRSRIQKARTYLTGALELDPNLPRARAALDQLARQAAEPGSTGARIGQG